MTIDTRLKIGLVNSCLIHGCKLCYPNGIKNIKMQKRIEETIKKDKIKEDLFNKYGYNVIYIWEHEIKDGTFINKF